MSEPAGNEAEIALATRPVEAFRVCRDEVKHEYNVMSGRLASYITSQSFLVSAYTIAMGNTNPTWGSQFRLAFTLTLAVAGLVLSYQAYPGIARVCEIINLWHDRQADLVDRYPGLEPLEIMQMPGVSRMYRRSLWFARSSPWTFAVAWVVLAGLTLSLHVFH